MLQEISRQSKFVDGTLVSYEECYGKEDAKVVNQLVNGLFLTSVIDKERNIGKIVEKTKSDIKAKENFGKWVNYLERGTLIREIDKRIIEIQKGTCKSLPAKKKSK
jgi:hypothetical protein